MNSKARGHGTLERIHIIIFVLDGIPKRWRKGKGKGKG